MAEVYATICQTLSRLGHPGAHELSLPAENISDRFKPQEVSEEDLTIERKAGLRELCYHTLSARRLEDINLKYEWIDKIEAAYDKGTLEDLWNIFHQL